MTDLDQIEMAALAYEWSAWARHPQIAPETNWKSWGIVSGRGWGKTRSCAELTIAEVMAGRVKRIGFCSFNLDETERTMIYGKSGLLACSPPWFPGEVIKGVVCWPNGTIATPFTPEVPAGPRGPEHDWLWCSELASWPASTRAEFFSNMKLGNRMPGARMIFDTTPKRRNPLVRELLDRAQRNPTKHIVVRGITRENADNLDASWLASMEAEIGNTMKGREELEGIFLDDDEAALFRQEWIDRARRDAPTVIKRRILSVDPAISMRSGTDATGIVDLGLGVDRQVYVLADLTARMAPEVWGALVVDRYVRFNCDTVVVERNRGGDMVAALIRACAQQRGMRVEVVGTDAPTRHDPSTIYVRELVSRKSKTLRAEPVASLVESGRVSFVRGADLTELEDQCCTWTADSGESPNALDAFCQGVSDLADLSRATPHDGSAAIAGAAKMQQAIAAAPKPKAQNVALLLGGRGGAGRI